MPALSDDLRTRVNQQIANELGASHLYLSMAAWFDEADLPGMAKWLRTQADEERGHAMKFYSHLIERNARVELAAIDKPRKDYDAPLDVFEDALRHERDVTKQIYELYEAARSQKDYALQVFLDWFVTEQVQEENMFDHLVAKFKRVEGEATGLMLLDKELGEQGPRLG